ncbi:MAG TPA: helix-turn-helix transcriptional regulator [Kineosporiaceae bacterium]|nr:helix-turn-helix transcriptional regulator [Kineosporiaceae bacterium]
MARTAAAPATGSTMIRRQLGRKLRRLREACGKTREDVVATRLMSLGKLKSIEYGRSMVRPGDVYELGRLYGAPADTIEGLRHLALATTQEAWWEGYGEHLARNFDIYLDLESCATELWAYEPNVIHGLLQTEDYALAVERGSTPDLGEKQISAHVQLRMLRQNSLRERDPRPRVHLVLGEPALRLRVGDDGLHARQHERLLEAAEDEFLDLRVLPADGAHPGLLGGFTVMDFPDPGDPSVVYVDSYLGSRYHDREAHVARHREVFQVIYSRATPIKEHQT